MEARIVVVLQSCAFSVSDLLRGARTQLRIILVFFSLANLRYLRAGTMPPMPVTYALLVGKVFLLMRMAMSSLYRQTQWTFARLSCLNLIFSVVGFLRLLQP